MFSPLTKTLKKIFTAGFYRIHGGGLIFLFVTVISSCFYINTLGDIAPGEVAIKSLVITLTLVSNPIMMGMFILVSLIYAIKSRQYIAVQLLKQENEFLYYSCTAIKKSKQFKSWFWVQIIILIPIFIYAIYSAVIGFIFGHYLIPICILIYLFLLAAICALINLKQANELVDINKQTLILKLTKKLNKPFFFTLFLLRCK